MSWDYKGGSFTNKKDPHTNKETNHRTDPNKTLQKKGTPHNRDYREENKKQTNKIKIWTERSLRGSRRLELLDGS